MTIRDFIASYNETFQYIDKNMGTKALKSLFQRLSDEYCTHLEDCVKADGMEGCMKYWGGGEDGTLGREQAACEITLADDVFTIRMNECPSVKELRERGKEPYCGGVTYCDHCAALYRPVLARYGLSFDVKIGYDQHGNCLGKCLTEVRRIEK